jgi:2-amino-4-hydroxy-6-hydroxymethyldihydropteridine diphosphokinase
VREQAGHRARVRIAIGLGANLGDPRSAIGNALAGLAVFVTDLRVSPLYRTAPVGGPSQPSYLNAAAVGSTRLGPHELLERLRSLEIAAGRKPSLLRNAPRPLDLDLLLYGNRIISSTTLTVPHPRMAERRFVLTPLADLVPGRIVPGLGKTVATLLSALPTASASDVNRIGAPRSRPSALFTPGPGRSRSER